MTQYGNDPILGPYKTVRAQADGKLPDAQAQARASVVQKWNRRRNWGG